ncbi:MAG: sigma-70 family RNA polymerase sigma factor [Fimbriimonadaceae bacterium]|nr:sigma-70 family RNA polymerase sigma factor [Fimbriimonadaceae bacterium]
MMIIDATEREKGSEARFSELMKQTYKKVFNMAYRLAGNRADAEDLAQEAYYRAYRSFKDFEGDKPFENWIFRIVTRLFLDLLRTRKRRVQAVSYDAPISKDGADDTIKFDVPDNKTTPEDDLMNQNFSEEVERALGALNPEQRLLIQLADIEQVPYNEIAEMFDKPVGTIRSRLHRAHKMMRDRIERCRMVELKQAKTCGLPNCACATAS